MVLVALSSPIRRGHGCPPPPPPFFQPHHLASLHRDSLPRPSTEAPRPPPPSPPTARISPAVLFIIVVLAVIFFVSGLLHLLVRLLIKKHPPTSSGRPDRRRPPAAEIAGSEALQRQLQQLFHLHDAGLDQAFIDALPVFLYKEIVGGAAAKEPFDCAVCLCEFAAEDKLRLLPFCGHAFHINCIDTWLLSNSTCPLCRGALCVPGLAVENPMFEFGFDDVREEGRCSGNWEDGFSFSGQKSEEAMDVAAEKRVLFPVRLGKFRSLNKGDSGAIRDGDAVHSVGKEEGETSSSSLNARRCYSMGSYQYVLGNADLRVTLRSGSKRYGDAGCLRARWGIAGNSTSNETPPEGKKISARSKGESFSVSKIWQWPNNRGKLPIVSSNASSVDGGSLPWLKRSVEDT